MSRKNYQRPVLDIIHIDPHRALLINSIDGGDTGIGYGGGGSGPAFARRGSNSDWDDERNE